MKFCGSYLFMCIVGVPIIGFGVRCDVPQSQCGAYAPGDIMIGILGSVHSKVKDLQLRLEPKQFICTDFDLIPFVQSLAVIYTIDMINDSGFLPGIRLGYQMCDPCVYGTKALQCVEHMLAVNESLQVHTDNSIFNSPVKAFMGERFSELSIPVAKLLSLYMIPQISCISSSPALSDKLRYPSFFRVIPSDVYQTTALAKLMKHFKWDWVGVVTLDDDYGRPALENFLLKAEEENICVDFQEVLPNYLGLVNIEQRIKQVTKSIRSSTAQVVLLILRPELVQMLFEEMIKMNTTRIWIASDLWVMTRFVMKMNGINKVGDIFGFSFTSGTIPGFKDFLQNLKPLPGVRNNYISVYKQMRFNCTSGQQSVHTSPLACNVTDPEKANDDYLVQTVDLNEMYNQRVAVHAIADAIKTLLKCNDTACSGDTNFQPWRLVKVLQRMSFTVDNQTYSFNENGDIDSGYDLMMWKESGDGRVPDVVGKFLVQKGDVEVYQNKFPWSSNTIPVSRCSEPCHPGTVKNVSDISCCYTCINCSEGFYSNELDQSSCEKCRLGSWSLAGSTECQPWKMWYLEWSSAYSIVVMIGTGIGIVLLIFSFTVFILYRTHDLINGSLLSYCFMKLGLLLCFGSVIAFLGRPTVHQCMAQQTMYALGFTLCMACIFGMAFRMFITYMARDLPTQRRLERFNKPFVFMCILTLLQGIICVFWLIFDHIDVEETQSRTQPLTLNRLCTYGRMYGFGAMHIYIALLSLVCFLLAYKGKHNDSIVFSVLIHLFVWLCLIPVFVTQTEIQSIVQVSAIMVSNYGVIVCHFLPKCYKILLEITLNMEENNPEVPLTGYPPSETISDTAVSYRYVLSPWESMSIHSSVSHSRFSFTESNITISDINSVHLPEVRHLSIRRRRQRTYRTL